MSLVAERQKALLQAQQSREREEQMRKQRQANIQGITPNEFSTAAQRVKAAMEARGKKKAPTVGTLSNTAGKSLFEVSGNVNARLAKYCNMLKMGVPRIAVEQKMRMEGMTNVSGLDKCAAKSTPSAPTPSTRKTTRNIGIGTNNFLNTNRMSNSNNFSSVGSVPSAEATHYISKSKDGEVYYEPFDTSSKTSWNVPVGTVVRNKNGVNWKYAGKNKASGKNYFENTSNNLSAPSRWLDDMEFNPQVVNSSTIPPPPPLPNNTATKAKQMNNNSEAAYQALLAKRRSTGKQGRANTTIGNNNTRRLNARRASRNAALMNASSENAYQALLNRRRRMGKQGRANSTIGNNNTRRLNARRASRNASLMNASSEAAYQELVNRRKNNRSRKILAQRNMGSRMNRELGYVPGVKRGTVLNTNFNRNMNARLNRNMTAKRAVRNWGILKGTVTKETVPQLYTYLTGTMGKTADSLNFDYNKRESFATIFYDKYQKKFRAFFKVGSELISVESQDCNELLDKIMQSEEIVKKITSVCGAPPANMTLRDHVAKCAGVTGLRRAAPTENTRTNAQLKAERNAQIARNKAAKNAKERELAAKADNIVSKVIKQANMSAKNAKGRELVAKQVLATALPTIRKPDPLNKKKTIPDFKTRRRVVRRVVQYIKQGVPKEPGFFGRLMGRKPTPVTNDDIDLETDRLMANIQKMIAQKKA